MARKCVGTEPKIKRNLSLDRGLCQTVENRYHNVSGYAEIAMREKLIRDGVLTPDRMESSPLALAS